MDGLRIQTNLVEFACHLGRNRFSVPVTTVFPVGIFILTYIERSSIQTAAGECSEHDETSQNSIFI